LKEKGEDMDIEEVGRQIVDSSVKVHRALGPGLLESTYPACLAYELRKRGLRVDLQVDQPINYGGLQIDSGYRLDMVVENSVIIEHKAVEHLLPVHQAQLLTYLRLRNYRLGFLINWNVRLVRDGIHRMVNKL
jgi:GxxExxY protein